MEKEVFVKDFSESIDKNLGTFDPYFEYKYNVFFPLRGIVFEACKCLMLEFNYAAITLCNLILERLLKLALIEKEIGLRGISNEKWNEVFSAADKRYGSINLSTSIDQCQKMGLINDAEKEYFQNSIRDMMRNGFSHADASKVLLNAPDQMTFIYGSFSESGTDEINLNVKAIPSIQGVLLNKFVDATALQYFKNVFELMQRIEMRLVEIDKQIPGSRFK